MFLYHSYYWSFSFYLLNWLFFCCFVCLRYLHDNLISLKLLCFYDLPSCDGEASSSPDLIASSWACSSRVGGRPDCCVNGGVFSRNFIAFVRMAFAPLSTPCWTRLFFRWCGVSLRAWNVMQKNCLTLKRIANNLPSMQLWYGLLVLLAVRVGLIIKTNASLLFFFCC